MPDSMKIDPIDFARQAQVSGNKRVVALEGLKILTEKIKGLHAKIPEYQLDEGTKAEQQSFTASCASFIDQLQRQRDLLPLRLPTYVATVYFVEADEHNSVRLKKCTVEARANRPGSV